MLLRWDKTLEPNVSLKKLRKDRLDISQQQFDHIQYQLYIIGCLTVKEGHTYDYPSSTSVHLDIPDKTYIHICKHLCISNIYKFLI